LGCRGNRFAFGSDDLATRARTKECTQIKREL
jgi:hypothetical protein